MSSYNGNFNLLIDDIRDWKIKKSRVLVFAGPKGRGERLRETLLSRE